MPTYIIATDTLEAYYSDANPNPALVPDPMKLPLQSEIGFDPKDKNNVAYTKYQKNYALFRFLGGFNVRPPKSFPSQVGDVFTTYIDNITTNSPTNSKTYTLTIASTNATVTNMIAMIGMPD